MAKQHSRSAGDDINRLGSVLGLAALLVGVLVGPAEGQRSYPLTGNARFQIGDGVPMPIGVTPPPNGKVLAHERARITQTSGPDPKHITLWPSQLIHPGGAVDFARFPNSNFSAEAEIHTNITVRFPAPGGGPGTVPNSLTPRSGITFKAGGRTGAATVTFCPGQSVSPSGNPACTALSLSGGPGTPQHRVNGFLRYTATSAQFGGAMRGAIGGTARLALLAGVPVPTSPALPCDHAGPTGQQGGAPCRIIYANATPLPDAVLGGPFGAVITASGTPPPAPGGLRNAKLGAAGTVLSVTSPGLGLGIANPVTSFGGPWTTGMVTIVQSHAVVSTEVFILTGSDNRVNGIGTISLVAGGLSHRSLAGPNANRGWLNLTVVGDTPALSGWGLALLAILLAGAGARRAARGSELNSS